MISEDTITSDIWNAFRTIFNSLGSVTIQDGSTITIKNISSGFPDEVFQNKSNYPLLVLESPDFDTIPLTFRGQEYTSRITLEILTNQGESADKFKDKALKAVRDNLSTLNSSGIDEVEVDDTASDNYDRNKMKIHSRKIVWRFK